MISVQIKEIKIASRHLLFVCVQSVRCGCLANGRMCVCVCMRVWMFGFVESLVNVTFYEDIMPKADTMHNGWWIRDKEGAQDDGGLRLFNSQYKIHENVLESATSEQNQQAPMATP